METSNTKNVAALIHLSTLTQYFIPFGNYIFPILLWSIHKKGNQCIDDNGKQVINFQLSLLLYTLLLILLSVFIVLFIASNTIDIQSIIHNDSFNMNTMNITNLSGLAILIIIGTLIFIFIKLFEFLLILYATIKTYNNEKFKYPFTIRFIK